LLHPEAGSNIAVTFPGPADASIFADCDVVVSLTIENQRVAPVPMEGRAAAATWDGSTLTQWACSQGVHGARDGIANALGLDPANVRAITPDVGGGFGAKSGQYPEEILVGWVAKTHGHAVRWAETRSENLVSMGHGRGQLQRAMLGGTKDGKFLAYRLEVLQDSGAYGRMGAVLPIMTRLMTSAVYDIPKVEYESYSVLTNTTPTEAYRGAGRPEASPTRPVSTLPRSDAAISFVPKRFPSPHRRERPTTAATTRARWTAPFGPLATTSCGPNKPVAVPRATRA